MLVRDAPTETWPGRGIKHHLERLPTHDANASPQGCRGKTSIAIALSSSTASPIALLTLVSACPRCLPQRRRHGGTAQRKSDGHRHPRCWGRHLERPLSRLGRLRKRSKTSRTLSDPGLVCGHNNNNTPNTTKATPTKQQDNKTMTKTRAARCRTPAPTADALQHFLRNFRFASIRRAPGKFGPGLVGIDVH
mmetsp:Transcript_11241/g.24768  ORF Transcript_11241/g.24768 Transcript_11241/m.24768 type:complete len:192 (+) Transcript_11241:1572-2147(+)